MRFLIDENVPIEIGLFLREQGHDVLVAKHSPLKRADDKTIWACAVRDQRVIVTHDKDFPIAGVGGRPAGVILLRPHDNRPPAIKSLFVRRWAGLSPDDLL